MRSAPPTLDACAARLREAGFPPFLPSEEADGAALALPDLTPAAVAAWRDLERAAAPDLDAAAAQALLASRLANALVLSVVGLRLAGLAAPLPPAALAVRRENVPPPAGVMAATGARFRVAIRADRADADGRTRTPVPVDAIPRLLLDRLAAAGPLAVDALGPVVADAVTSACLEAGRRLGAETEAFDIARKSIEDPRSALSGYGTGLERIDGKDARGRPASRWFVRRAGCCRWYRLPDAEPCDTCVRRTPADRTARLLAVVAGT